MSGKNFGLTPFQYKTLYPMCMMLTGVLMVASIDIYLPAAPFLKRYFATSEWMIQLSMMLTPIIGSLVGLFYGHWSDIKGRRPAMLFSLALFALGSFLCCFAWNIESFLSCRFIQAIGAGGMSVMSISILADMFSGAIYAKYMATFSMSFPITFAVAPVLGAHLFKIFGWQANFWFLGGIGALLWLILIAKMPETHKSHRDILGQNLGWGDILANFKGLASNRNFMRCAICHGLPVAIAAVYSANSSFIFIDGFHFAPTWYAYIQLLPVMVNLLGSIIYRQRVVSWGVNRCIRYAIYLNIGFLGLTLLGVRFDCLQQPYAIILIMFVLNLSLSALISSCGTMALEHAPKQKGLAVALLGLSRSGSVALLVLLVGAFFDGTIIPVYAGMAILTAALLWLVWPYARKDNHQDAHKVGHKIS